MKKNFTPTLIMPDSRVVVINTTPLIALSIATGSVEVLRTLYDRVIVPHEVQQEILAAGNQAPGVAAFMASEWLERLPEPQRISDYLNNMFDRGEASVIQAALERGINRVCIDEKVGRRIARLNGLKVTGSIGILAKARQQGYQLDIDETLTRLRNHGIWLGKDVEQFLRDTQ
jgi:predicted nucleic acid-binding protein